MMEYDELLSITKIAWSVGSKDVMLMNKMKDK